MVDLLLIISLFLPLFLLYTLLKKRIKNGKYPPPPGPPSLPIIGHFNKLKSSSDPHGYLWKLSKIYGPLMSLKLGFVPAIVVSSARIAKEVFKTHDLKFSSRPFLTGQQKLSYNGLDIAFTPYDDYWREMRKTSVLHLFSLKRVQSFRALREDEVRMMIQKISKCEGKVINLSETLVGMTSSIICRVAFGKRYEDEGRERSRFHSLLNEAQAMMGVFFLSDYFPMMGWVDKWSGLMNRLDNNFKEFDQFYQEIIDDHLDPKREKSEQDDITDVLLKLKSEDMFTIKLTYDHIKAVLMNVFIGGTDTSAAALVWALTALMKNPKVMAKVQVEIRKIVNKKETIVSNTGITINEDDLHNLPYLKAVVKETTRLYPPLPLLVPRETVEECVIDGYQIPLKTLVYVNMWAIGRDPEAWSNPDEFLPERFLSNSIDFKGQDYGLIPFGAGRRGCPAILMGAVTVELALANLLHSFDWELGGEMRKEDIDVDVIPGVTMHKKTPLCLIARNYVHDIVNHQL